MMLSWDIFHNGVSYKRNVKVNMSFIFLFFFFFFFIKSIQDFKMFLLFEL